MGLGNQEEDGKETEHAGAGSDDAVAALEQKLETDQEPKPAESAVDTPAEAPAGSGEDKAAEKSTSNASSVGDTKKPAEAATATATAAAVEEDDDREDEEGQIHEEPADAKRGE